MDIVWTPTAKRTLVRLPEKVAAAVAEFAYVPLAENPAGWASRSASSSRAYTARAAATSG